MAVLTTMMMLSVGVTHRSWMDVSLTPQQRADKLVANMTVSQLIHMFHGSGSGYVGNVEAIPELGIPAIKMNDGPQGFRDNAHPGTSTAWPSGLTIASTWDEVASLEWGSAMGAEFYGKGANVQLGPGVCVARVPQNGRNFEYISGEDPFLGYTMVQPAIKGIQSKGVIANAKHYVNNNQETNRQTISEDVDERTQFEIYYPPFEGAIEAEVGSMMCSYNKIRGNWSCENSETLQRDLKERMGFSGWVMSDWGATHSTSINQGLDQEMPGASYMGNNLQTMYNKGYVTLQKLQDSAKRIFMPMFQMGVFDDNNNNPIATNVTSVAHNMLARNLSSRATVLLKNDNKILPISKAVKNIAVIGSQAANPIVHGGGSGQVVPYYTSAPYAAILSYLNIPTPTSNCSQGNFIDNTDFHNQDNQTVASAASPDACCLLCAQNDECTHFSWTKDAKQCWMKSDGREQEANNNVVSGICKKANPIKHCNQDGVCVTFSSGSNPSDAAKVASEADIALVFVATTSHEGSDRSSLSLGNGQDELISAVAAVQKDTVVSAVTPGALLTPWRDQVKAILIPFMPGQEYGNAVTELLFGKTSPSGRLPLSFPVTENDEQMTKQQWPGVNLHATYSEKMLIGYRWYTAHNVMPAFPFGHGLTYTNFAYGGIQVTGRTVTFEVTNTGAAAGVETPQLYIGFPTGNTQGEPPVQLKAFSKVSLQPGEKKTVSYVLPDRAVSYYDITTHQWAQAHGSFTVYVGPNVNNLPLSAALTN